MYISNKHLQYSTWHILGLDSTWPHENTSHYKNQSIGMGRRQHASCMKSGGAKFDPT